MMLKRSGFEINKSTYDPHPVLTLSELHTAQTFLTPFRCSMKNLQQDDHSDEAGKIVFDLSFQVR